MQDERRQLEKHEKYDLIVIGGGINGAGIARDAALRGLRVALVEKKDFGAGTTQAPTRLIHGGLRYLEYFEFSLVFESLQERKNLLRIAPHLVRPLAFIIPVYRGSKRSVPLINLGLTIYDLLSINTALPAHRYLSRDRLLKQEPGLRAEGLQGGALYYDCQVPFVERLCLANVLDACEHGATTLNYTGATGFIKNEAHNAIRGVIVQDMEGNHRNLYADMIVNAAGPWVDEVTRLANPEEPKRIGGTKGTHLVVDRFPGAPDHAIYVEAREDQRPFFIVPWLDLYLIGTTDDPYSGDLDAVHPTGDESEYLLRETNRIFPQANLSEQDIIHAYSGVRPLPAVTSKTSGAITRRHIIYDHAKENGISGLISIIGGKITTYRNLSRQTVDLVLEKLGKPVRPSNTHRLPLPGGDIPDHNLENYLMLQVPVTMRDYGLTEEQAQHLIELYGSRYNDVLALTRERPDLLERLSSHTPDIAAQALYAARFELARTLSDFFLRRTQIGSNVGHGLDCTRRVAALFAEVLGWNAQQQAAEIRAYEEELDTLFTIQPV